MRQNFSRIIMMTLVASVGGLVWLLATGYDSNPSRSLPEKSPQRPLSVTDMAYDTYRDEELVSSIKVQQFQVRPRKYGIFRVKNINEVALEKARFDLYRGATVKTEDGDEAQLSLSDGLSESVNGLAGLRGMGQITRATIDYINLNIYREKKVWLRLQAEKAIFDPKKKLFDFEKARLLGPRKNFQLVTSFLRWDEQRKLFYVPGEYRLIKREGISKGKGAVVDGEFNVQPVSGETSAASGEERSGGDSKAPSATTLPRSG